MSLRRRKQQQLRIRPPSLVRIDESCSPTLDEDISYDRTEDDVEPKAFGLDNRVIFC